jgi:hypothetical protein
MSRIITGALPLVAGCALAFATSVGAAEGPGLRVSSEQQFLELAGDRAQRIAPGVYRIDRGGGRSYTVGFGPSGARHDIAVLEARLAELEGSSAKASADAPAAAQAVREAIDAATRALEAPQAKASTAGPICDGVAGVSADAISGLAYGEASASGLVSVFGPGVSSYSICRFASVRLDGGQVATGNNDGCTFPVNTLGGAYSTSTGWFGPAFCQSAASFASATGSCAPGGYYPNYISISAVDNPCGI